MTLDADEFIRRFLLHALPDGFHRIRHYGFLANGFRGDSLAFCRRLLEDRVTSAVREPTDNQTRGDPPSPLLTSPSVLIAVAPCGGSQSCHAPATHSHSTVTPHDLHAHHHRARSQSCGQQCLHRPALPINLSDLECRPFLPRRLTQLRRIALDHRFPAQTTCCPLARRKPGSTSTSMISAVRRSSSSRPRGTLRCVERCCPSAAQARRSETCSCARTCSMQARRRAGLRSFPARPPAESACQASNRRPPCAAGCSRVRDPSGASLARSSARRTPGASDSRLLRSHQSGGSRRPCPGLGRPEHPPASTSQRSLQACIASLPSQSSLMSRLTSSRTTSLGVDHWDPEVGVHYPRSLLVLG